MLYAPSPEKWSFHSKRPGVGGGGWGSQPPLSEFSGSAPITTLKADPQISILSKFVWFIVDILNETFIPQYEPNKPGQARFNKEFVVMKN